jgi:hypothetical protein
LNFINVWWFLMHSNLGFDLLVWETLFANLIGMNHILDLHVVILNMIPWFLKISVTIKKIKVIFKLLIFYFWWALGMWTSTYIGNFTSWV